jgi:hypothetical protein
MAKKSTHPGKQLFDHLSGRLDERAARAVEDHLPDCAECRTVANVVGALKTDAARSAAPPEHPGVSELASFFYGKLSGEGRASTAAHVASCRSCADDLAEYARAERAARDYDSAAAQSAQIPAAAWKLILEWEESSYARPRAEGDVINQEMLLNLSRLLSERKDMLLRVGEEALSRPAEEANRPGLVPVVVVDKEGGFRGVEMFEKVTDEHGASTFRHADLSERFDNKPLYALLDFGGRAPVVVSDIIRRNSTQLRQVARPEAELRRADYFIIED